MDKEYETIDQLKSRLLVRIPHQCAHFLRLAIDWDTQGLAWGLPDHDIDAWQLG